MPKVGPMEAHLGGAQRGYKYKGLGAGTDHVNSSPSRQMHEMHRAVDWIYCEFRFVAKACFTVKQS